MITVTVLINGQPIATRTAVNVTPGLKQYKGKWNKYMVDDGTVIKHRYKDGAIVLAKKLLDLIKEVK